MTNAPNAPLTLEQIRQKYSPDSGRETVQQGFEQGSLESRVQGGQRRLSEAPTFQKSDETSIQKYHQEVAAIRKALIDYAREHSRSEAEFADLLKQDGIYTLGDNVLMLLYGAVRDGKKRDEVKNAAFSRRSVKLDDLVNFIGEILNEQYQTAKNGKDKAIELQHKNIEHMKYLDRQIIENLKGSVYTGAELLGAQQEVERLLHELTEIDAVLDGYRTRISASQAEGKLDDVMKLTDEMSEVLGFKEGILDGKYAAEGSERGVRMSILEHAENIQSATGSLGASRVNYVAINAVIDSYFKLEIIYNAMLNYMVPVFKIQAQVTAFGQDIGELTTSLSEVVAISNRLMDASENLVMVIGDDVQKLLQTPPYDTQRTAGIEARIRGHMGKIMELDKEWAANQQRVALLSGSPHYAKPQ